MLHHDPSTKPFLSHKMKMFQSIIFSTACFVVLHPCNHDSHFQLYYHWCLCSRCPDLFLSAHRLLSERQADRLLVVIARGSVIPSALGLLLFPCKWQCAGGWAVEGGNRLKDLTQICLYIRLCMMEMLL